MELSSSQKMIRFFSSKKKFKAMEIESRQWIFTCENCQKESNVWDAGGIRYKAKGKPSVFMKCPSCGKGAMQKLIKQDN